MADINIKFPTMDEFAKEVAEKALDEILYDDKSIREWMQIIASEDAISRQAVLDAMYELCDTGGTLKENPWRDNPHIDAITDAIDNLPPVTQKSGKWLYKEITDDYRVTGQCSECKKRRIIDNYCSNCGTRMESEDKG